MTLTCAHVAHAAEPEARELGEAILRIEASQFKRARTDAIVLGTLAAAELATGIVLALDDHGVGYALSAGGVVSAAATFGLIDMTGRRKRALDARFTELDGKPREAWLALAEDRRRLAEARARSAALATGVYAGVAAVGALAAWGATEPFDQQVGLGLAIASGLGAIHHAGRWRRRVRVAGDLAMVPLGVPGP